MFRKLNGLDCDVTTADLHRQTGITAQEELTRFLFIFKLLHNQHSNHFLINLFQENRIRQQRDSHTRYRHRDPSFLRSS